MPPKKKVKGKAKKGKKKLDEGTVLEEKYRRSVLDVTVLKEHLALRTDAVRQAQCSCEELKSRMKELEQDLHQERHDKRDITADLTRQYKFMKTDLGVKVQKLETEVTVLQQHLVQCQTDLKTERELREKMQQEKDATISDLQSRLDSLETGYGKLLHDSLDTLLSELADTRLRWESESTTIHQEHKELLATLGLNPLHL
ncbi:coiled-coil domain-containing protein 153 [Megalops cyprinoides]|uniref:coiled-coil domain-containing protein 153 n=1 Tax=Megalops cyprinoides TaxID=118141 RepID=UPI0018649476|nr:coiled-coil domain-containing protein 153 [Megalops cyprinoides]